MASNGNGEWDHPGAQLKIAVFPPWWQSLWAQLLYLLALVLAVAAIMRGWSNRRLRMYLERLERQQAVERERTRIAQNIHDDLGASLTRISLLTQSAKQGDPAQTAKFEEIYETAHAITRSMDEIVWAVNPKCDDMENLVYYVGNFAQGFLGAAGIRCRLDLPKVPSTIPLTSQVRHNLFLCCKEALNNVVKHAQATEVIITITVDDASLQIAIADNGHGMAAAKKATSVLTNTFRTSSGNGLKNMRLRMTEMSGGCAISTAPEGGTTVTFKIALPPQTA
jgi:signal transduction histidine kinase